MNEMDNAFSCLTLHELHEYVVSLESQNKKLINQLRTSSKLNYVLENMAKSCQTGYSLLRKIEINKCCDCNEHLNQMLRKSLNHSIDESNVWLDQYQYIKKNYENLTHLENEEVIDMSDIEESTNNSLSLSSKFNQKESQNCQHFQSNGSECKYFCCQINDNNLCANSHMNSEEENNIPFDGMGQNLFKNSEQINKIESSFDSEIKSSEMSIKNDFIYKCNECNINFTIKSNWEHHMLFHLKHTFNKFYVNSCQKFRRVGPGRPPNNDTRVLTISNIGINISEMSEQIGSIPVLQSNNSTFHDYKRTRYSGVGRYRCPWPDCGYTPHFLRDLRRHMSKHTGDKKHKCHYEGCDFITVWKTSLLQHQRKKHNHQHVQHVQHVQQINQTIVNNK